MDDKFENELESLINRRSKEMDDKFEKELESLINRHSKENEANTPDFILAQYIAGCLLAFNTAVQQRETWYGRDARPTLPFASGDLSALVTRL